MPFTMIKGTFHVRNYSPDGDSIRFEPRDRNLVVNLAGSRPRFNARGHVQLRIEAIDTLETHFNPPGGGGTFHQPLGLAHDAAARLMDFLQIRDVQWDNARRTVVSADDAKPGYILSRSVERNGRPVAFVFAGDAAEADGSEVDFRAAWLRASYNWAALNEGLAYPTYYKGLFNDLRDELSVASGRARAGRLGVYAQDGTQAGFDATSLEVITDNVPILPKLFRRLSDYMVNTGSAVGFREKMEEAREPVLDLVTSNFTHFDTFIEQADQGTRIRLTRLPEQLVFDETIPQPGPQFAEIFNREPVGVV